MHANICRTKIYVKNKIKNTTHQNKTTKKDTQSKLCQKNPKEHKHSNSISCSNNIELTNDKKIGVGVLLEKLTLTEEEEVD